ncbi:lipopolysaccharide biosynthesis protein [Shewanella sp. TB4-MNA-CIBAN-0142]|uniref:lipopolysaccharide biosynthesis protein n=1 Tax=Shewanella sp. TB4-MNA-CIBAN-0142 TaxID=3140464 RepID=UPI003334A674
MHDKQQLRSGFIWSAIDSFGNQAIGLVISLILANFLGPSVYGLIAMLAIFIAIANVFVNSGFGTALIRKIDRNQSDFATTFYFSLAVAVICYLLLYIIAPYISDFYNQPELTYLTRVLGLIIVINTFTIIPRVLLTVKLNFKAQAMCNITSLICSGTMALSLAYLDYGVWALVGQQMTSAFINTIMLNIVAPWRPQMVFCKKSFKELFGFGSKLLLSGLLDTIYNNAYSVIIGKQYSAAQLGFFNQANILSSTPAMTLTAIIQKVTYPMLSNLQDDTKKLDEAYLLTLQFSAIVIFPVMFGVCIIAKPLIAVLLGAEWQGSAELISIITMALVLYPIHAINLNMLQVKGRSDLFLKLEIIKKLMMTVMLIITVPLGIKAMCYGMVITSYLALFVNTYYTGKLSSITAVKQLTTLLPIGIVTLISAEIGYEIGLQVNGNAMQIATILTTSLIVYLAAMLLFQRPLLIRLKKVVFV